jgi:DNA-binding NtrC family response regulator
MESLNVTTKNDLMRDVLNAIERISTSDLSVVILGERGTGKEWAARLIHNLSPRAHGPFWPFDCAAIPPESIEQELLGDETLTKDSVIVRRGALEEAAHGTILLNEIASMPESAQKKIARVLEYKNIVRVGGSQPIRIDVRIIATQSHQSERSMGDGLVEKGMFYRISPIVIELPPLRNRREDIPLLVQKFLSEAPRGSGKPQKLLGGDALHVCLMYDWPGNVLQLKNAIEYASIMSTNEVIQPEDLPSYLHISHPMGEVSVVPAPRRT